MADFAGIIIATFCVILAYAVGFYNGRKSKEEATSVH